MGKRNSTGARHEVFENIKIVWSCGYYNSSSISRAKKKYLLVYSRIMLIINVINIVTLHKIDVIVCYAPGVEIFLPILVIKNIYRIICSTIWGDIIDSKVSSNKLQYFSAKIGQYTSVKYSDLIINLGSRELEKYFIDIICSSIKVITLPPPVDVQMIQKVKYLNYIQQNDLKNDFIITYAGSFKFFEGLRDLIMAINPILKNNRRIKLVLAGGFTVLDCRNVEKDINKLLPFLKKQVWLPGQLNYIDVYSLLKASDILVIPKINHTINKNAMPIKLGEYLATGKPVVSAKIGGIGDYIKHMENGLLYSPGDIVTLRNNIEFLMKNEDIAIQIGKKGIETANTIFDFNIFATHLTRVLGAYRKKRDN